jgi:hypothetical protein
MAQERIHGVLKKRYERRLPLDLALCKKRKNSKKKSLHGIELVAS